MKKLLAFDLDDTLAVTKSPIDDRMANVLPRILDYFDICVISGGKYEQFELQVVNRINASPEQLRRLHLMPTCGTKYYHFNEISRQIWWLLLRVIYTVRFCRRCQLMAWSKV